MNDNELVVCELMRSVQEKYFSELQGQVAFSVKKDASIDGVHGRARFGIMEIILTYSDDRILEPKYRMGLVPVIAHELSHYINPVEPEVELRKRLPDDMVKLWEALIDAGHAKCSMGPKNEEG